MKDVLKKICMTVLFVSLTVFCLYLTSLVVERKSSYDKNEMFMREARKGTIDVFFLGSSHVINGINPIQLFEEHGITSYNLGGYGSVPLSSYWQLRLALDYCTPKLVVADAYMLENDIRYIDDPASNVSSDELHLNIDRFPLSKTKIEAINDMFADSDKKAQYLADFSIYHDRWKELSPGDFKRITGSADINRLMGAELVYDMHAAEFTAPEPSSGTLDRETWGTTYTRKIIEECQSRGIAVALVTLPYLAMQDGQDAAHAADRIAGEYGVPVVNMLEIPGLIDINTDLFDAGHLNAMGAAKVTAYTGSWLAEHFSLTDHRGDPACSDWDGFVSDYHTSVLATVSENDDIYRQLITLQQTPGICTWVLSIRGQSISEQDTALLRLLKTMGAGDALDQAASEGLPYLFVMDHGTPSEYAGFCGRVEFDTTDGHFTYEPVSELYRILLIGDDEETNYLYADDQAYADIQLLFVEDGGRIMQQYFTCSHFTYDYSAVY